MTTFVLVHGAWHGAWCWDRLAGELCARGHRALSMDVPVDDGAATFEDYARTVVEAAAPEGDDVVLVGHSLGAMVIPLVATARPASTMVFLCGVIPNFAGAPWDDVPQMEVAGAYDALITHEDGSTSWPGVEEATRAFYGDCRPEDAAWAFERLRHQNSTSLWDRPYPIAAWPSARRLSIHGADDPLIGPEYSRHVARVRLGVESVEIPGGHSPMLARPAHLADVLLHALEHPAAGGDDRPEGDA